MNRIIFFILSLSTIVSAAYSQDSSPLSLQQAIEKAMSNRYEMKIQSLNIRISENEVKKVNTRNRPQITSDIDMRYNSQLQTNILPGAALGPPGTPDRPIQFGTKYNTLLGISGNQYLYNPQTSGDKNIANAQTEYQRLNQKVTETEIKQQVTEAYFYVLLCQEKSALSDSNLRRVNNIYTTADSQLKEGTITPYDFQKYRIDLENAKSENEKNLNNLNLSRSDLWYKMGEDSVSSMRLAENITALYAQIKIENIEDKDFKRPELDLEKAQRNIYDLNIKKQSLSYIPSIYMYGNYAIQNLSNKNPFDGARWFPYNYFGLHASIPIYDGSLKSKTKAEYLLRGEVSRINYEKLKRDYSQESRNTIVSMKNAEADLKYQQKNLKLVDELYQIDTDRLKNGIIKQNDLATTYYTLLQTQTNYLNAVYNYLLATVKYKKAKGIL